MKNQRIKCFNCGQVSQITITCDRPKCPGCSSLDVRLPIQFSTDKQELWLFHVAIGMGGFGTQLEVVRTTEITAMEVTSKNVTGDNREYRNWLSAFRDQYEFWYLTASDAWMHYANLLDQQAQKCQQEASSLLLRGTQAVEESRRCKEKEEFEARPSHKMRFVIEGPIVSLETVLTVPKDAKCKELYDIANKADWSSWKVFSSGIPFPNSVSKLHWTPVEEPASK